MLANHASLMLLQECTRVLGVLASPLCPMQAQYLQQPLLGKVLAYLKLRMKASYALPHFANLESPPASCIQPPMAFNMMQDPDSSVRETAADALGQIAEHLYKQQNVLLPGDTASNPVLRAAFDTMLEHKKEMQQAGAYALSQVQPDPMLACDSSHFHVPLHYLFLSRQVGCTVDSTVPDAEC